MKVFYEIIPEKNLANIVFIGQFNLSDFIDGYRNMLSDSRFNAGMNVVWDARAMDMSQIQLEDIMQFGEFTVAFTERRGRGKSACVIDSAVQHSIARLFELGAKDRIITDFRIFDSMEQAQQWLQS